MKKIIVFILVFTFILGGFGCKSDNSKENEIKYEMFLEYTNSNQLKGVMNFTFVNNNYSSDCLKFCLYANAYSKESKRSPISYEYYEIAYPNGKSCGDIIIEKIQSESKEIPYKIEGENNSILVVDAPTEKYGKSKLQVDFTVNLANVNHRLGYGENTVNLCNFYPILCVYENDKYYECEYYQYGDPFYSENASYEVTLKVPSEYSVASSLYCKNLLIEGATTTYTYEENNVKDIAFTLSKNYEIVKNKVDDIEICYYYVNDSEPEKSLQIISEAITFFNNEYCQYPYSHFVVSQADFIYGGMEYPCLVYIDKSLENKDKFYTIVHEIAHQWWYGLVGVNEIVDGYIDEGLTELSTLNFFNKYQDYQIKKSDNLEMTKKAVELLNVSLNDVAIDTNHDMNYSLKDYSSDIHYVMTAYYKSLIMFSEIESEVGYKKFNKFLKDTIQKYKYTNINTKILEKEISKLGKNAENIFKSYVYKKA